ncbi:MAG: hypothetical protein RBR54_08240 [Sulfurimonas sp.]|jgi:hypothetical protein|nr:hypothetical protein [Sulfurimonas sp.]
MTILDGIYSLDTVYSLLKLVAIISVYELAVMGYKKIKNKEKSNDI